MSKFSLFGRRLVRLLGVGGIKLYLNMVLFGEKNVAKWDGVKAAAALGV